MVTFSYLLEAYEDTIANKRKSDDCVEFGIHLEKNLAKLLKDINSKTLHPSSYTFIAKHPKPREVFASDFATRVAHHYLDIRLRPLIEAELTDVTFNNRIGKGTDAAFNKLVEYCYEVSKGYALEAWVISADLSGYFPNASQDIAYSQLSKLVEEKYSGDDKDDVLYLLRCCIYSNPTAHCYRKSPISDWDGIPDSKSLFKKPLGIGAAIGFLIWQNEMNYYLNDFDHYMVDVCHFHYLRFVDDMRWVVTTEEKEILLSMFPQFREMLAKVGCKFNEKKFSCQRVSAGGLFIGRAHKCQRIYVSNRIKRNFYAKILFWNKRPSLRNLDLVLASLNSYTGIIKHTNGYKILMRGDAMLSSYWHKYIELNPNRLCYQAKAGYKYRERVNAMFGHIKKEKRKKKPRHRNDGVKN